MTSMEGKVAFVTGAVRAPGMGRATALRLARHGADVVCVDIAPDGGDPNDSDNVADGALDALADEVRALGQRALTFELDLVDASAVQAAVDATVADFGRLDMCCHFAGGTGPSLGTGPLLSIDERAWDRCIDANLISAWIVAKACAEQMVRAGEGSIVLLSSFAARNTPEGYGAFSAAREGVVRLVEVLGLELAASGVRANAVLPLGVAPHGQPNPGLDELATRTDGDIDGWVRRHIPLGRLQSPDEVAAVAAFLCSDDASFISGQAIAVSGGAIR
jgi:NAD(P)-dependent dehydrogenase (short-subunit alcohol dehydrogenase family)